MSQAVDGRDPPTEAEPVPPDGELPNPEPVANEPQGPLQPCAMRYW